MRALYWFGIISGTLLIIAAVFILTLVRVDSLTQNVKLLQPRNSALGANILVYESASGRTIVDSQLAPLAPLISFKLGSVTGDDKIILTHWHPDHSGGYISFASPNQVWAHANAIKRLATAQTGHHLTAPGSYHEFPGRNPEELPAQPVSADTNLGSIHLFAFSSAHSDGDLAVYFAEPNIFAVGDLVWPGAFPFVDIDNDGSVSGLVDALNTILLNSNETTLFVPGHGNPFTWAQLNAYKQMIIDSSNAIACTSEPASIIDKQWGEWTSSLTPVERWIEIVQSQPGTCHE